MSNHSIVLSSSLCRDSFPSNHGGEFSNYLNQSLEFDDPDESWTVALSEIYYQPDSWENIREGFNEMLVTIENFLVTDDDEDEKIIYYRSLEITKINMEDTHLLNMLSNGEVADG